MVLIKASLPGDVLSLPLDCKSTFKSQSFGSLLSIDLNDEWSDTSSNLDQKSRNTSQPRIVWVHERCHKQDNEARRQEISVIACNAYSSVVSFKKACKFTAWQARPGRSPFVLLTDWREVKPCIQAMNTGGAAHRPLFTVVLCENARNFQRASVWAQTLPPRPDPVYVVKELSCLANLLESALFSPSNRLHSSSPDASPSTMTSLPSLTIASTDCSSQEDDYVPSNRVAQQSIGATFQCDPKFVSLLASTTSEVPLSPSSKRVKHRQPRLERKPDKAYADNLAPHRFALIDDNLTLPNRNALSDSMASPVAAPAHDACPFYFGNYEAKEIEQLLLAAMPELYYD